jgi:hypothetical protein
MHQQSKAYNFDPNNIAPPEVQRDLMEILKWRDSIVKDITEKIDMVPGLSDLIDELTNALNACTQSIPPVKCTCSQPPTIDVYTILAPYVVVSIYLVICHRIMR